MKTLVENLGQYAAYHRDSRNIVTLFIGIPMIVLAVVTSLYYLRLDLRFGAVMSVLLALSVHVSALVAAQPTMFWLVSGIGLFVIGWVFQFVGHFYEGKKPAFVDDIMGLLIRPLFVVAEAAFLLGLRKEIQVQVESLSGAVNQK